MSTQARFFAWFVALAGGLSACGGSPEDAAAEDCIPNQQIACSCPGGALGVKECAADGSGWGECTGCQGATEGCTSEPDCDGCTSCFDSCACQGGDAKACLKQCTSGAGGGPSGGGGSPSSGGSGGYSGGGSGGYSGGGGGGGYSGGGSGGYSGGGGGGGVMDCQTCVSQSCGTQLAGCSQTSGCLELVQCAQSNGCALNDYGCLLFGCGTYLINFQAVPAAMSLGGCAAQACAMECS